MRLWLQIVLPRVGVSGAPAAYFQHGKRGICCATSAAACWQQFCNVSPMQLAKKYIPRWCLQGVVTFFLFCFCELWISGKQNCYELSYWVWEEEGEGLCSSCFALIWQHHAVMGAATNTCSKANQVSEPWSWQQSLSNPRPGFSWEKMHEEGMISIIKALGKLLRERRTWLTLSVYWKGWRKGVTPSHILQLLSVTPSHILSFSAKKSSWCPLRKSSKCILGIGCPCLLNPEGKLHIWELLMAHAHACGSTWVRQRGQDDQCLACIFSPALNTSWNLGCPLLTSLQVQDSSADSAVSPLSVPGLEQDSQREQWWEDKLFHGGWRWFVYQSGSLALSPALWSWLLNSAELLMVLAES